MIYFMCSSVKMVTISPSLKVTNIVEVLLMARDHSPVLSYWHGPSFKLCYTVRETALR